MLLLVCFGCAPPADGGEATSAPTLLQARQDEAAGTISVFRAQENEPILTQNAAPDFRPFLHPIASPDGQSVVTEFSPGHHKHQTGLYWGFTRVNGRDYFLKINLLRKRII